MTVDTRSHCAAWFTRRASDADTPAVLHAESGIVDMADHRPYRGAAASPDATMLPAGMRARPDGVANREWFPTVPTTMAGSTHG